MNNEPGCVVWTYNGHGGPPLETLLDAIEILRDAPEWVVNKPPERWSGHVVARLHPVDWRTVQMETRYMLPVERLAEVRMVDASRLLPFADQSVCLIPDASCDRRRMTLTASDGRLLAQVIL